MAVSDAMDASGRSRYMETDRGAHSIRLVHACPFMPDAGKRCCGAASVLGRS
jgi:hypothetical protein